MVLLPALVFGPQIEGSGVLQIWWEHNCFIASFSGKLDSEIPGVEGDEGEIEVLRGQIFGRECIEAVDCIAEGARIANVFPGESCQAGYRQ